MASDVEKGFSLFNPLRYKLFLQETKEEIFQFLLSLLVCKKKNKIFFLPKPILYKTIDFIFI